ncbi:MULTISPECIES: MbtH family NRPS accessory protein [Sorangium]|uniref:Antibiotic synthesis protein MbtH n=1 Tax=Sorangium cellulosum TaxID=56 RepID=A0A4P2R606_SORCE|nr:MULTISPECIES: MbtH family NRPS accessory protein [Sorangium]AUX38584.1 antibiotic synthesis protein MbtH [Sorangium cellulosum]
MSGDNFQFSTIYHIVVNHEQQYSIWPIDRPVPAGWSCTGPRGAKDECLACIEQVWIDMRPLSLRDLGRCVARNRS